MTVGQMKVLDGTDGYFLDEINGQTIVVAYGDLE